MQSEQSPRSRLMTSACLPEEVRPSGPDRIVKLKEAAERSGLSRSTIERKSKAGTFAKIRRLSERRVGILESELEAWIAATAPRSEAEQAKASADARRMPAARERQLNPRRQLRGTKAADNRGVPRDG